MLNSVKGCSDVTLSMSRLYKICESHISSVYIIAGQYSLYLKLSPSASHPVHNSPLLSIINSSRKHSLVRPLCCPDCTHLYIFEQEL